MRTETHMPLTPNRIKALRYDGRSRDIVWDASPNSAGAGFGVRVYKSGKKSYVLQYRPKEFVGTSKAVLRTVREKRILKVLGDCDLMNLSTAREMGRELLEEIEVGIDPSEDRGLEGITLSEFIPVYLQVKKQEGIAEKSLYDIQRRLENYLTTGFSRINKTKPKVKSESGGWVFQTDFFDNHTKKFRDKPLSQIKRSDFHELYQGICTGKLSTSGNPSPVEANRLHVHLSNIFKIGEIRGAVDEGHPYPTRLVKKQREKPRKRYLSDPELKRLYSVLQDEPQSHALYLIQLMCHQGTRKVEQLVRVKNGVRLSLKWDHVHLDRVAGRECEPPHLFVGTTKNGDKMFSVLSPQSIKILEHLKSQRSSDDVFPVKDIRYRWEAIREKAGLGNFNLHDLRHCVGTWLGRLGYTELLIGRTLNHRTKSVTQQYSLIPHQEQEKALTDLADWLEQTVGPPILKELVQGT